MSLFAMEIEVADQSRCRMLQHNMLAISSNSIPSVIDNPSWVIVLTKLGSCGLAEVAQICSGAFCRCSHFHLFYVALLNQLQVTFVYLVPFFTHLCVMCHQLRYFDVPIPLLCPLPMISSRFMIYIQCDSSAYKCSLHNLFILSACLAYMPIACKRHYKS